MAVQLIDFDSNRNGRRYTDADREAAYTHWRLISGRSIRKTAEALDMSPSTVGTWHTEGNWKPRASKEDREETESTSASIRTLLLPEVAKSIKTGIEIRDDKTVSARDRLAAAQWIAGMCGFVPVTKSETSFIHPVQDADDRDQVIDLKGKSPDELRKIEEQYRGKRTELLASKRRA